MDLNTNTVVFDGETIRLTGQKADVLSILVAAYPGVARHEWIIARTWAMREPDGADDTVKVLICQLRRRLRGTRMSIENVYGEGYRLAIAPKQERTAA